MIRIGITGQSGFLGTHLFNTLYLDKVTFQTVPFEDDFFSDFNKLKDWVKKCDVIVHFAAVNRHKDLDTIYTTNLFLVRELIRALEESLVYPHILFSSSTQENRENAYGNSKKEGRRLFEEWAVRNNSKFTSFLIPNVFGPFGNPFYNSVVATFCHQLTHNEQPRVDVDSELNLIYVGQLIAVIIRQIHNVAKRKENDAVIEKVEVDPTTKISVSDLLRKLEKFQRDYFELGLIPNLDNEFDRNLFNTLICYIDHKNFYPFYLKSNSDNRGSFVEILKISSGGQVSFSTTYSGITRGNHFHTRKAERFCVIKGKALISLRKFNSGEVLSFNMDGYKPSFVDMPVWFTHSIKNTGREDVFTVFWISEFFNPEDPDTYFESVTLENKEI